MHRQIVMDGDGTAHIICSPYTPDVPGETFYSDVSSHDTRHERVL